MSWPAGIWDGDLGLGEIVAWVFGASALGFRVCVTVALEPVREVAVR